MVMLDVLRLLIAVIVAFFAGKLISRLRLPSILGWLITGMVLGPHALGLLNNNVLDSGWFDVLESILECTVGLMIGTELIWSKLKKAGKQIIVTTITESVGLSGSQCGVWYHFLGFPDSGISCVFVWRNCTCDRSGAVPLHCQ